MSNPPRKPLFPTPWNGAVLGAFAGWLVGLNWGFISAISAAIILALALGGVESLTARYDRR